MIEIFLLGIMQDGGLPQAGCRCRHCRQALTGTRPPQWVASLGILDRSGQRWYLVDATPDLPRQVAWMQQQAPEAVLSGILITHAHMGHYTGLLHLGREAWNTHQMPVWGDRRLCALLRQHAPWSQLVAHGNLTLHPLTPGVPLRLAPDLHVRPIRVPHRNEWSDMLAFRIESAGQALFYCPDADRWEGWDPPLESHLQQVRVALLDGTFYRREEIAHRALEEIPHPCIREALPRLQPYASRILFTHLNHTNPLLHAGPEREALLRQGFGVARQGQRITLSNGHSPP